MLAAQLASPFHLSILSEEYTQISLWNIFDPTCCTKATQVQGRSSSAVGWLMIDD
jgi:hypothetical protein